MIAVQDTGVGIEPALQDGILDISTRHTTSDTNNEKGTGLCLVLCKEFIELNHGLIWLENKVGQGTTIYFSLPTTTAQTILNNSFKAKIEAL